MCAYLNKQVQVPTCLNMRFCSSVGMRIQVSESRSVRACVRAPVHACLSVSNAFLQITDVVCAEINN